jgi:hypothetical protein
MRSAHHCNSDVTYGLPWAQQQKQNVSPDFAAEVEYLPKPAIDELEHLLERSMAALHGLIKKKLPPTS